MLQEVRTRSHIYAFTIKYEYNTENISDENARAIVKEAHEGLNYVNAKESDVNMLLMGDFELVQ